MAVGMRMRDFYKLYFPQVQLPCDCHEKFPAYLSDTSLYSSKPYRCKCILLKG